MTQHHVSDDLSKRQSLGLCVLVLLCLLQHAAWAVFGIGDIVNDPLNLIQTTWTAARTLQSNTNEVLQINNQIQSLINEAKHLVSLPMSYIDQIEAELAKYYALMEEGRGMAYRVQGMAQQFEDLYNVAVTGGGSGSLLQRAQAMLRQVKAAGQTSAQAQGIYDRLFAQRATTQRLVVASQGAIGELQAQQATNQMLAVMVDQQASLQQLQATHGRLQMSYIMREVVTEEQAQMNAQQFMQGFNDTPFRGPKQGQGFALPLQR
jgi:P-type conjugative transfer protein TrbJ